MDFGSSSLTNKFIATLKGNGQDGITFNVSGGRPNYYITSTNPISDSQEFFSDFDLEEGSHSYTSINNGTFKFVVGDTDGSVWQFGPVTLPFDGVIIGISQAITPKVNVPYTITNCTFTWTDCYGGNGSGTISSGDIKHVCSSTRPTSTGCRLITNRLGDCSNPNCATTTTSPCTCYSVIPITPTTTLPQPFNYYAIKMDFTNVILGNPTLEDQYINYVICQGYTVYQMYDTWSIISGGTSQNVTAQTNLALFVKKIWLAGLKPVIIVGDPVGPNPGDEYVPFDRVRGWETTYALPGYELWGVNYEYEYWNIGGSSFSVWISAVTYAATLNPNWNISVYMAGSLTTSVGGQADQVLQAPIDIIEVTNYTPASAPNPSGVVGIVSALSTRAVALGLTQDFVPLWSAESSLLSYDQPFGGDYFGANPPNFVGPLATWTSGYNALGGTPYPNVNYTGGLCMFNFETLSTVLPACLNVTTTTTAGGGGSVTTSTTGPTGGLAVSCQGPTCDNAANGSITVTPSSVNSPYTYRFTKGVITYTFTSSSNPFTYDGFSSGTWNVLVTDSQNATENGSCTLSETFAHSFTANGSNVTFTLSGGFGSPNNTNYYIASVDSGGNYDGRVFVSNITNDGNYPLTSLANGSYIFVVGDTDGCVYQFQSVTLPAATQVIRTLSPLTLGDCTITWTDCYGGSGTVDANYEQEIFVCSSSLPISSCDLIVSTLGNCNHPSCVTTTTTGCLCYIIELAAPQIISFTPTSGPVGTTVTITGENLGGTFQVTINGLPVTTFTVVNGTTITFVVPPGASSGPITVTTPGGTATSSTNFTVTIGPLLTSTTTIPQTTTTSTQVVTVTTSICNNCTLITYFTITSGVLNQSGETPKKVYLEFVRCGGVITATYELPVAATYYDYSDLPFKYCVDNASVSSIRFYVYTTPSTTVNVTGSVTKVLDAGLCNLCVTSIPTPVGCACANMSVFVSGTDVGAADDGNVRIHYYDCNGVSQEAIIANVGDTYLLDEFCILTGASYPTEVVHYVAGVLIPAPNSYTVITGCCDNNSFLFRGINNSTPLTLNNPPLNIPASSCKYVWTDCNGVQQNGTINSGEQLAVCSSFPPVGLGCTISYTVSNLDCLSCFIVTTTTTCNCFTIDVVEIDSAALANSTEIPQKVYMRAYACGQTSFDVPIPFTLSGKNTILGAVCAVNGTAEFYYIQNGVEVIDQVSFATYADCCACFDVTLSSFNYSAPICYDLITDSFMVSPSQWTAVSIDGLSTGAAQLGFLEITEGLVSAGGTVGVSYSDGTQFSGNPCGLTYDLSYSLEVDTSIIDGLGSFKIYFSDVTGSLTNPNMVTIANIVQPATGSNPTGTASIIPPFDTNDCYVWVMYTRENFAPYNATLNPGQTYPIIEGIQVQWCVNVEWVDCQLCQQGAIVTPTVSVNACVYNGLITYQPGIDITNNGICNGNLRIIPETTTTTTVCNQCIFITQLYISQEAIDQAPDKTVYFTYTPCGSIEGVTWSFTEPGEYYLDGSDCMDLYKYHSFYIIIEEGKFQTFIDMYDWCTYEVGGFCCISSVVTTSTTIPCWEITNNNNAQCTYFYTDVSNDALLGTINSNETLNICSITEPYLNPSMDCDPNNFVVILTTNICINGQCVTPIVTTTTTPSIPQPIVTTTTTCSCITLESVNITVNPQDYDDGSVYLSYDVCGGSPTGVSFGTSGIQMINECVDNTTSNEFLYGYIGNVLFQGQAIGTINFGNCCP